MSGLKGVEFELHARKFGKSSKGLSPKEVEEIRKKHPERVVTLIYNSELGPAKRKLPKPYNSKAEKKAIKRARVKALKKAQNG